MRTTIRLAKEGDLPRIRQLVHDDQDLTGSDAHRYVLVLDDENGGLAAAAAVTIDEGRGHLGFVAIAPDHEGEHLEDRMIGVAEALCSAFGCDTLDVARGRRAA